MLRPHDILTTSSTPDFSLDSTSIREISLRGNNLYQLPDA